MPCSPLCIHYLRNATKIRLLGQNSGLGKGPKHHLGRTSPKYPLLCNFCLCQNSHFLRVSGPDHLFLLLISSTTIPRNILCEFQLSTRNFTNEHFFPRFGPNIPRLDPTRCQLMENTPDLNWGIFLWLSGSSRGYRD